MKRYETPKADFINLGNEDILTASIGITLQEVDFTTKGFTTRALNEDKHLSETKVDDSLNNALPLQGTATNQLD